MHAMAIEAVVFIVWALCLRDAWKRGGDIVAILLGACALGLLIEVAFVSWLTGYTYGDFVLSIPLPKGDVPLWVAAGWGAIIHLAQRVTTDLPTVQRPAAEAVLACSVDLALDPVAQGLAWWSWDGRPGPYFGVPYDNFTGWLLIVGLYGAGVHGFRSLVSGRWRLAAPVVGVVVGVLGVLGSQLVLEQLYPLVGEGAVFLALWSVLVLLIAGGRARATRFATRVVAVLLAVVFVIGTAAGLLTAAPALLGVLIVSSSAAVLAFLTAEGSDASA